MKLLFICFFISCAFGQDPRDTRIDVSYTETPLRKIFLDLMERGNTNFVFPEDKIKETTRTLHLTNTPFRLVLDSLLQPTAFTYEYNQQMKLFIIKQKQVTFQGIIYTEDGDRLPHAIVSIPELDQHTYANQYGRFSFVDLPYGSYNFDISHVGYVGTRINRGPTEPLNVSLTPRIFFSEETTVTHSGTDIIQLQHDEQRTAFSASSVSQLPDVGMKDVFRAMQSLPGVSGLSSGDANLYIRGGTPDQNLIRFDGINIYHVDHMFGYFSAFNPHILKDVQLYKGSYSAKYGGRLSGIVDLTGKNANFNTLHAKVGADLLSNHAYIELPLASNLSMLTAYRTSLDESLQGRLYKSISTLISSQKNQQTVFDESGIEFQKETELKTNHLSTGFYDFNAKLTYTPTAHDFLNFNVFKSNDDLSGERPFEKNLTGTTQSNWGNTGVSTEWFHEYSPRLNGRMLFSYSNYKSDFDLFHARLQEPIRTERNTVSDRGAELSHTWHYAENKTVDFGAEFHHIETKYTNFAVTKRTLKRDDKKFRIDTTRIEKGQETTSLAFYANHSWEPYSSTTIQTGLRFNSDALSEFRSLEPRLSITQKIGTDVSLNVSYGTYSQYVKQTVNNNTFENIREFWLLANTIDAGTDNRDRIPVSTANKFHASLNYKWNGFNFTVDGYRTKLNNLVEIYELEKLQAAGSDSPQLRSKILTTYGEGLSKGLEFLVQKQFKHFRFWVGYTLSSTMYTFAEINEGNPFRASHSNQHKVDGLLSYDWNNWSLSSHWTYMSGKPYTQLVKNKIQQKAINNAILPAIHKLDLKLSKSVAFFGLHSEFGVSVTNVYDHKNIIARDLIITNVNERSGYYQDTTLLGITPTLYFEIGF